MSAPGQRHSPFSIVMRGYDRDQVTDHIRQLEADLAMMAADRDSAHAHAAELLNHLDETRGRVRSLQQDVDALSVPPTTVAGMSERLSRMLGLATEEAGEIRATARDEAAELVSVARQEADETLSEAQDEAARTLELAKQQADKLIADAEARAAAVDETAAELKEYTARDRAEAQREIAAQMAEAKERAREIVAAAESDAAGLRGAAHHIAAARLARSRDLASAAHDAHRQILDHLAALREHLGALPGALELSDDELALTGATETGDLDLLNRTLAGRDLFEAEALRPIEITDVITAVDGEYDDEDGAGRVVGFAPDHDSDGPSARASA